MRYSNVAIEGLGFVLPSQVVTSEELEQAIAGTLKRIGLPPGQIEKLSGVRERRWFDSGVQPSAIAAMAAERAIEDAGIDKSQVGALINASVSRDYLEPATASIIGGELGLPHHCHAFDVTHACLGFLTGLITAANMIELGQADYAVVTVGENPRDGIVSTLERLAGPDADGDFFRSNFATLTLGCGGAAAVLCRADLSRTGHRIKGAVTRSATEHSDLCVGRYLEMKSDPHGLLVHGVGLAVETFPAARDAFGWHSPDAVDQYVCHQVSLAHFQHTFEQLELPLERALLTFPYLGNCGPASLPLTLALGVTQGQIRSGQELCFYAVGSGLGCVIMGVEW